MGERDSPPDRDAQAVQASGRPVDRPEYRTLTADHEDCATWGHPIGGKSVLSSRTLRYLEFGLLSRICGEIPVRGAAPSCDKGQFPWLRRCESRRIVWSPLGFCCRSEERRVGKE